MLSISNPVAGPYRSTTVRVLLLLLLLAFVVNSVSALLVIHEHHILNKWMADPRLASSSQILLLQRQLALRLVARLAVSAVLILSALVFVWQRQRNVTMHARCDGWNGWLTTCWRAWSRVSSW